MPKKKKTSPTLQLDRHVSFLRTPTPPLSLATYPGYAFCFLSTVNVSVLNGKKREFTT